MKGFKTIKISDEFIPEMSEFPIFEEKENISSSEKSRRIGRIYFMPSALKDLDSHIHWGERRHDNLVEQGGYMLGNVYRDSKTNTLFAIVSHLVPVHGAEGTEGFLDMGTDASYDATLRENELIQEQENKIRRVGWYHTHPDTLGVFMSGTDMKTQRKSYSQDWQFAVVLNPQKQIWRGFRGSQALEVDCIMVCDKKDDITCKFISKPKYTSPYNYGWDSYVNYGYSYNRNKVGESPVQPQATTKDTLFVRLNGESIYIGDCIMAIDTFMARLYNSITIEVTTTKPNSISMDLLLQMHIAESQLEFFTITCSNHIVNITEKEQVMTKFENPKPTDEQLNDSVHAIVHYKDSISEEEAAHMTELYNFTADNELFCIYSMIDKENIRFYVCDHDRNAVVGEITY